MEDAVAAGASDAGVQRRELRGFRDDLDEVDSLEHRGVEADGAFRSELSSAVDSVVRFALHNMWAFVVMVAVALGLMTRLSFGAWLQLQIRLLSAVLVFPVSADQLQDANFLLGQVAAVCFLVVLASWTVGNTEWWASRVDELPPTVLPAQRHLMKLFLLSTVRSAAVLVAIKLTVAGWSWYLRPPGQESGPVPVLPGSAAGFSFASSAAQAAEQWRTGGGVRIPSDAEVTPAADRVRDALAASSWALFNPTAREAMSLEHLSAQARGWVQFDCPSCAVGRRDVRTKAEAENLAADAAAAVRKHPQLQPPGIGFLGVGVDFCPACIHRDEEGGAVTFLPPSDPGTVPAPADLRFFSVGRTRRSLSAAHAWAPFPVLATACGSAPGGREVEAGEAVLWRRWVASRVDSLLMHAVYLSTVALWTAVELGFVRVAPRGDCRRAATHAAMVLVHALAVGLFKAHGRLNAAGVGFPTAVASLLRSAPLPLAVIGGVSLLLGMGTSAVIKVHFGFRFFPLLAIIAVNLVAGLWASRAGELLAEALATDVAASEHFGVSPGALAAAEGGCTASSWGGATTAPTIVGASVLSPWASPGGVRSLAVHSLAGAGLLVPLFWPAAALARLAAVLFALWVAALWFRVAAYAQLAGGVFLIELRDLELVGSLSAREAPTLLAVVSSIIAETSSAMSAGMEQGSERQRLAEPQAGGGAPQPASSAGELPQGARAAPAEAIGGGNGGSGPQQGPQTGPGAAGDASTEFMAGRMAMSALGLWIGVDRLRKSQERLVLSQRVSARALNFSDADVDTGRLSLRLSVAPSAVQRESLVADELLGPGWGVSGAVLGAMLSMFPSPPDGVRPLVTARFSGIRAQGNAAFVASREARMCLADPGRVPEPPVAGVPAGQPVSSHLELEVGMKAVATQLNALRSGSAMGRVELSVIVDPPKPRAAAQGAAPQTWLGSVAQALGALGETVVPRRAEFPLLTIEDGKATGLLSRGRRPSWRDLKAQSSNLTKASSSIRSLVASLQERMHGRVVRTSASRKLIHRLGLVARSVAAVSRQLERMRASTRSREAGHGIQVRILETAFMAAAVHSAEISSGRSRDATRTVLMQLSTCLVELGVHTFMDSVLDDHKPLLTVGSAAFLLAVQVFVFRDSKTDLADRLGQEIGDQGLARSLLMVEGGGNTAAGPAVARGRAGARQGEPPAEDHAPGTGGQSGRGRTDRARAEQDDRAGSDGSAPLGGRRRARRSRSVSGDSSGSAGGLVLSACAAPNLPPRPAASGAATDTDPSAPVAPGNPPTSRSAVASRALVHCFGSPGDPAAPTTPGGEAAAATRRASHRADGAE